jgi:HAD superfamily hydrolase (TIGR01450 family)
LVDRFDGLLVDLDGVVYLGEDAVEGAIAALTVAQRQGVRIGYVTNNAARTPEAVAAQLESLGVSARPDHVLTSAQVAAECLRARFPAGSPVLAVGGDGLHRALAQQGLRGVLTATAQPVAAVQGFGRDVGWRELAELSVAVRRGVYWVATNLDLTLPTPHGEAPGNGALVQAVVTAAGRGPDAVIGKPRPTMFVAAVRHWGLERPLAIGDRLDTDIAGAQAAGLPSMLVLSGVSAVADLLVSPKPSRPDYVGRDLRALHMPHPDWPAPEHRVQLTGWQAFLSAGVLTIDGEGEALDAVRCASAVSWWALDRGESVDVSRAADRLGALLFNER